MKILIFEYICGGGFCTENLPNSLAKEGLLMLKALVNDLMVINKHSLSILLDWRFINHFDSPLKIIPVQKEADIVKLFEQTLITVDAVWLIAPETENILFNFTQLVELSNKILLSSPSPIIAQTTDKWQSYQQLFFYTIPTVTTRILSQNNSIFSEKSVIKIRDGVGCENNFIVNSQEELTLLLTKIDYLDNYIIQPFIEGENLSISALFKQGKAELICVNHQTIQIINQQFKLLSCEVNYQSDYLSFQLLINQIAIAFPDLWGYIGIDLIQHSQHSQQLLVLEINPRLTSSYVGISAALKINVAEAVLKLLTTELQKFPSSNASVIVDLG